MKAPFLAALFFSCCLRAGCSRPCPLVEDVQEWKPAGLLGATIARREPDLDRYGAPYPEEIVLLRRGKLLHVLWAGFFNWHWMFWQDGRQIVADQSPLHFFQVFVLIDVGSGKQVALYAIPQDTGPEPAWARALEQREVGGSQAAPAEDCRFRSAGSARPRRPR